MDKILKIKAVLWPNLDGSIFTVVWICLIPWYLAWWCWCCCCRLMTFNSRALSFCSSRQAGAGVGQPQSRSTLSPDQCCVSSPTGRHIVSYHNCPQSFYCPQSVINLIVFIVHTLKSLMMTNLTKLPCLTPSNMIQWPMFSWATVNPRQIGLNRAQAPQTQDSFEQITPL